MEKTRSYPSKRRMRGETRDANLTMLSARIDEELCEYVTTKAYETRKSKQDIVAEALRLYRQHCQMDTANE